MAPHDRAQTGTRLIGALAMLASMTTAGCTTGAPEQTGTTFTSSTSDPTVVQQIMADSAWLQKNRLPKLPAPAAAPKAEALCPPDKVRDRGRHQLLLPADLMTTMVLHDAKPWAYLRYDVDGDGTPLNVTVEQSSGLKSFDRAAIETVTSWRFDLSGGLKDAHGCVSEVAIT